MVRDEPLHVLVIGECVATWLGDGAASIGWTHDFLLTNNYAVLPEAPPRPVADYGFQLIQIPLRSALGEWEYLTLPFDDVHAWQQMLEDACSRLSQIFEGAMRYCIESSLLTFVGGFLVPQQNPMGRMLVRDDPRNLVFVVESLNRHLVTLVASHQNAYYVDFDQIASGLGKQFIQDDSITASSHGSFLSDWEFGRDRDRLEPLVPLRQHVDIRADEFRDAVWMELRAMHRTVRGLDVVKLVVVDLDDTLWRGIVAEEDDISDDTIEGWPMGLIEALQFLRKRGVLLAIVSKNDESRITGLWDRIMGGRLRLDDFVVRKINWRSKADNLQEILHEVNLLPTSVVFVDDNPRERAEIRAAFPDVRILGADVYKLKRIMLWAPETQVPFVSSESSRRTEMVQGQIAREQLRKRVSREEFLNDLGVEAHVFDIRQDQSSKTARAIELLNKTNQFNTTGRRWSAEDLRALESREGSVVGFSVRDKFTDYGMVGVIVLGRGATGNCIEQVVMSCRVFGLDVELAVLQEVLRRTAHRSGDHRWNGIIKKLAANQPSWDVFQRLGFTQVNDEVWSLNGERDQFDRVNVSVRWEQPVGPTVSLGAIS